MVAAFCRATSDRVVYVSVRPSVCLSVHLYRVKNRYTQYRANNAAQHLEKSSYLTRKISLKLHRGQPQRGRQIQVGYVKTVDFRQMAISRKRHNKIHMRVRHLYKSYSVSNDDIADDLD